MFTTVQTPGVSSWILREIGAMLLSTFAVPIGWTAILKRTGGQLYRGHCFGWAAALAYYSFLALFPALLFVVSLASFLPIQPLIERAMHLVGRFAPGDVVTIARQQLVQVADQPRGSLLVLSLVGTIWSTSSGMVALIGTLNQAHDVPEGRSWWQVRAIAIALTVVLVLLMLIAFTLVMVGPKAAGLAADWLGLGPAFTQTWQIVRWPAAFALAVTALGGIYHFAPDIKQEFILITPGAVAATVLWLFISLGFKWYVVHFGDYQKTYGAIGGVMVGLLWFYFSGLAILLGAQLNATIAHASRGVQGSIADRWATS